MFKDHFSKHAKLYADARPSYPSALFEYLSSLCDAHDCAWDCATGNGQAAVQLARYFKKVIATDASQAQIENAKATDHVIYRVATAEDSGIPAHSVDLITVAQALHWFNFDKFFKEVKRVLKPKGVLAAWCYDLAESKSTALNDLIKFFYSDITGPYWPKERKYLENHYENIPFPFKKLKTPDFSIKPHWNLKQLLYYFSSWSSVKYYERDKGENPVETWLKPRLEKIFHDLDEVIEVVIPVYLVVGSQGAL